jgi:hypothetical protein
MDLALFAAGTTQTKKFKHELKVFAEYLPERSAHDLQEC